MSSSEVRAQRTPGKKPCRLELNNSGAWKMIVRFDAAKADETDAILTCAASLAGALALSGAKTAWRVATDEPHPDVLMRLDDHTKGWLKASTTDPS